MTETDEWDFVRSRTFNSVCEWLKTSIDPIDSIASASSSALSPLEELPYIPRPASRLSSLKQNYYAYSKSHNDDTMPSPRKRTRDQLSITTASSGFNNIQLLPTTTSQPSKVRSNSPVRELRVIYRSATPSLKYAISADENTPQNVLDLIHELPLHGVGVVPSSLKV